MVLTHAFHTAKRIKTETSLGRGAVSVGYVAVELAKQIFGTLQHCRVLLVGAGEMAELAARHLRRSGVAAIYVANRTRQRAEELARVVHGEVVEFQRFREWLPQVDIVIASTAADHYLLTKPDIETVLAARKNAPVFLIDIAVPRNIEPQVNDLENAFLYDIDDLKQVAEQNRQQREQEVVRAEQIVEEELTRTIARLRVVEVKPLIVQLQERLEQVRRGELERLRNKLGDLSPEQEQVLEYLTRSIVKKLAHGPIMELRQAAVNEDGDVIVEAICRMFRLDAKG